MRATHYLSVLTVVAASIVSWGATAPAAVLAGKVTAGGQPVVGAWVQLNTGLLAQTDARGRYSFPPVPKATYCLQVFAPGKQPLVSGGIVAGKGAGTFDLDDGGAQLGLVHVKALRADRGDPCPVRIVSRWRASETDEFAVPEALELTSTLDARAEPLVPAEDVRPFIEPFGACLWCQGEAVIALPAGQAELTCTSGPLMRADQQNVTVEPGGVVEVAVSMAPGAALRGLGWVSGAADCRVSKPGGAGRYLMNLPLAAAVCRAEGLDWVALAPGYGADPAQAEPAQVAREVSTETFQMWLSPGAAPEPWGGTVLTIGRPDREPKWGSVPNHYEAALLKRAVPVYTHALGRAHGSLPDQADRQPWPGLAAELPFDLLADPSTVPALDIHLTSDRAADYFRLWALLLNNGFHLAPASFAETCFDDGVMPVAERLFVQVDGELTVAGVVEAIRRGATFVSSGPVVSFAVADALPGEVVAADDSAKIAELDAWLGCAPGAGVARIELLRAGRPVRTWDVSDVGPNHVDARIAIRERERTWFALRAYGAGPGSEKAPRIACTSPVYFRRPDQQGPTPLESEISGRALDKATGEPVAKARVTATAPSGERLTALTGTDGEYRLAAPAASMVEISHPRYLQVSTPMTQGSGPRDDDTAKFLAWDCPEINDLLRLAGPQDLLSWEYYERLQRAMSAPRLDFPLTPRR